jgi:glutaredoxin-like protein NrdH
MRRFDCVSTVRALQARNIEPIVVAVSESPDAAVVVDALGYSQFPVVVAGDRHWCGHRIDLMDSLLDSVCVPSDQGDVR